MDYDLNLFQDENEELEMDNQQIYDQYQAALNDMRELKSKVKAYESDILLLRDMLSEKNVEVDYLHRELIEKDEAII